MILETFLTQMEKSHVYKEFDSLGRADEGDVLIHVEQLKSLVALVRLYQKAWMQKTHPDLVNTKRNELLQKAEDG